MKVYIVTAGEYSDYRIMAVFTDYQQATYYCACHNNLDDDYRLEEWETDDVNIDSKRKVYRIWKGQFSFRGYFQNKKYGDDLNQLYYIFSFNPVNKIDEYPHSVWVTITTDLDVDNEKAARIMKDKYMRWRYEREHGWTL